MRRGNGLVAKIGVLDSGIGGLSVLREIHRLLPDYPTVYVGDQIHLPYGPRPESEVRVFVEGITRFLLAQGAVVIVLACNSASAASLHHVRDQFPDIPFVGMEPAVKPAAESTHSGVVGVLATNATANGQLYHNTIHRHAGNVRVITQIAPELVRIAEEQSQHTPESQTIIRDYLQPMLDDGADEIVLACTHFPFLMDAIQTVAGPDVHLIDPSPAVARQVTRVWPQGTAVQHTPNQYFTTGLPGSFQAMLETLIGVKADVSQVSWSDNLRLMQ
jgi:glutamate racemase